MIFLDEENSDLNYNNDVLLSQNIKGWSIKAVTLRVSTADVIPNRFTARENMSFS